MTWRGKLFSSLASPGHLETEAVRVGNPGVRVARPGRRAWWGQKVTDLSALFLTQTGSVRLGWSSCHDGAGDLTMCNVT